MLAGQPRIGELRDELRPGMRSFSVGNYVIYYRPVETMAISIEIVRVLHGGRDVKRLL